MVISFLSAGVLIGAIASCFWIMTGGSFLIAFALYSLVATAIVLIAALTAFLWSELREMRGTGISRALPAAE